MKKKSIFIILLPIILTTIGLIILESRNKKEGEVCFKNNCFKVQMAVTVKEQERGLMFRKNLKQDEGMLFVFKEEGEHPFWMKDTLIPLDIIWINQNKEVVFISENTQPCSENHCASINPDKKAQYVLELKGGTSKNIDLRAGDKIDFLFTLSLLKW